MSVNIDRESPVGSTAVERSTTLWLVDDSDSYRELLVEHFQCEPDIRSLRQFSSAESAIAALVEGPPPDVILLDIHMGGMSGLEALRPMKAIAPTSRIIILTTFRDFDMEIAVFAAGADGFLSKMNTFEDILDWVRNPRHTAPAPAYVTQSRIESSELDNAAQAPSILRRLFRFLQPVPRS